MIGSVAFEHDVAWRSIDGANLRADVFHPVGTRKHPAVVLVHGGAWWSGDKLEMTYLGLAFAAAGFVAIAPNYRIGSRSPYPDQVQDVEAAVRWVRRHASALAVDPRRVALYGSSAGGNLATLVGVLGAGPTDRGTRVGAVVSWSGIYDLSTLVPPRTEPIPPTECGTLCPLSVFGRVYVGRDRQQDPARYREASPTTHLDRTDPPELLVGSAGEPVLADQQAAMAADLARHGVRHETIVYPGTRHSMQYFADAVAPTIDFLRRTLGVIRTTRRTDPSA